MLIGDWQKLPDTNPFATMTTARVVAVSLLTRSHKRKDRVEIAPEQLHLVALEAEEASKQFGRELCVIGWYHSHPHITVFPSHVDLKTQLAQQYMDPRFFGIIVSCFMSDSSLVQRTEMTCFQSEQNGSDVRQVSIPFEIEPDTRMSKRLRDTYMQLPQMMYTENRKEWNTANGRVQTVSKSKNEMMIETSSSENSSSSNSGECVQVADIVTELYNAGVYGQSIMDIIDTFIYPATHMLQLAYKRNGQEIELLERKLKELQSRPKQSDYLIEIF